MKLYTCLRIGVSFSVLLVVFYFYSIKILNNKDDVSVEESHKVTKSLEVTTDRIEFKRNDIVLAVVACGDRLQETLNMLKSALIFSKEKLNFIVFAEDNLIESFNQKLSEWKTLTNHAFTYKVMALTFPVKDAEEWKRLFKPCAAQRLFLPNILKDVDSLLYMDTDTLFLTPVENIWSYFHKMNSSQMAALAPEHEDPNVGWYNRFAKHPFYGKLGVNSGVMLMNLTRMRAFQWSEYVVPIYRKYKLKITWGDQDIINIIFHYHPGKLYLYSCRFNFRPDHCMYMSVCKPAEKFGVAVVHGSRGFFHSEKQPVFQAIYRAFEEFRLGGDVFKDFYQPLEAFLEQVQNTNCGHIKDIFLKNVRLYINMEDTS
ncbi:glucoside xylosyltransferase 2 [Tribolium castaneum]|uniref:UDP-D-xylose:beta-D-glucoside alpha-1,3-D-xylosyltransferase n=1 Tax=Tribolium castaneum TaxID=7070 RepID=D6X1W8_TRICA|nr:PREDICTED: glucoside xylosyltransferase 2 [Tribolium castaneum]EFA10174.2 Glucoside xylosyltransferase 2-like Protein [Tribolium castaneum]|eukprot:XP_969798.1 PREDICTED: glucoside xylosyltransferase 2 [Tribolium castaneum]